MRRRATTISLCMLSALLCGCDDSRPAELPPPPPAPTEPVDTPDFSGDNAYIHCAALCALGPRPTGSPAYAKQVQYLSEQLRKAGWEPLHREFTPMPGRSMLNVHATFGSGTQPRPLLLTCHIDTKGQGAAAILGADDGASGAAAILEVARVLARTPELAAQVELVFFDGEEAFGKRMTDEDGLFGSRYDVARRGEELPRYLINLDMVGGAGKTIAVPVMDTTEKMYGIYEGVIRSLGLSEDRWTLYPGSYLDDHRPFAEAGVDTLNLIAFFQGGNWCHTQQDDMSRISAASLGETGRVVLLLIRRLLTAAGEEHQSS